MLCLSRVLQPTLGDEVSLDKKNLAMLSTDNGETINKYGCMFNKRYITYLVKKGRASPNYEDWNSYYPTIALTY